MTKNTKNLVIVESPAKARTLEKFLGKGFSVMACGGHIRDLPKKKIGVNVKKDFEPDYQTIKGKEKIIKELKSAAKTVDKIFLAPDPDREGEAIAWHLQILLGQKAKTKRIEFNEITKEAVRRAVTNPREIDQNRVNAQQARRILDRLVGYKLSPLLWKKVRKGLSAGRVQSVAVRLICEREAEIKKFNPQEYWSVIAKLSHQDKEDPFDAKLIAIGEERKESRKKGKFLITDKTSADKVLSGLSGAQFIVSSVTRKERKRYAAPPFITSTLQQEAARKLGFSAKRTMMLAQRLYEGIEIQGEGRVGLITYMRTDSIRIANEAEVQVREFIAGQFGKEYLPPTPIKYKAKKQAQDAHEAVRPTSVKRTPEALSSSLQPDLLKLYDLIWKRFTACQMKAAVLDLTSVDIKAREYIFRGNGSILKFEGFMKVYLEGSDEPEEKEGLLPPLQEKEELKVKELLPEQHFTEPPPRYTEASLVKELEQKGIGRPSTYAPIMSTIQDRGYVTKEGKALKPTEIGELTNQQLVKHFPKVLDITFTAQMEDDLDQVVAGKVEWVKTLREFYDPFSKALAEAETKMEKVKKETILDEKCPTCGKNLVIRQSRYGDFIACSGYPNCKYTRTIPEEGGESEIKETCDKCGKPMVLKSSRYGTFLACSGYPDCKNIKPILKKIGVACPDCGGDLIVRRTRRGKVFYGCSNYPKCKYATWDPAKSRRERGQKR